MTIKLNPDYDPDTWKTGYQDRQFGVGQLPDLDGRPSSALDAMSDPPAAMVTAAHEANPPQEPTVVT